MAAWMLGGRRWRQALAAVSLAAAGCWSGAPASAQDGSFLYEKQFNLSEPIPSGSPELPAMMAPMTPMAPMWGQVPLIAPFMDATGETSTRIIGGSQSKPGVWKSAVNIRYGIALSDGRVVDSYCGGSLIDDSWVLTAAHCVFREATGGVRDLKWVVAYADDINIRKGKRLRVQAVYVHSGYSEKWTINDLALLKLDQPTDLPRQKLASGKPLEVIPAGTMATVVGWGMTKASDPNSDSSVLMEVKVPIMSNAECNQIRTLGRPDRPATDTDFCAGYGEKNPNADSCNGDSGGPLYVSSGSGEPIQAGIVSYGPVACGTGGAYTSIGVFEQWIKQRVPKAVFTTPGTAGGGTAPGAGSLLAAIAGVEPGGPPSPHGQCAIDVYSEGAAANVLRVGSELSLRLTAGASGQLVVFSYTSAGKAVQLFPSTYGGAGTPTSVRAGESVEVPGAFSLKVSPPLGRYAVIAVILPEGSGIASVAQRYADMQPIEGFSGVLGRLAETARSLPEGAPRAVCTRQFDVVE